MGCSLQVLHSNQATVLIPSQHDWDLSLIFPHKDNANRFTAQSVLGAVQGLNVVKPDISKSTIVGTTCGILILLFLIQPLGTTKIAVTFAPIVIIWLGFNAGFGIYNLVLFDHGVLKAFNPAYAFEFMIRNKTKGWRMLGGVLLAFTGVEALFADLGAFSMRAIQLSWLCYTFPCLLLAYIGQAAYIRSVLKSNSPLPFIANFCL
jgi:KUP system potassium uptake protein